MAIAHQLQPLIARVEDLYQRAPANQQVVERFDAPWELSTGEIRELERVLGPSWDMFEIRHIGGRSYEIRALLDVCGLI